MNKCKYCGNRDESELALRSTRVGDEVRHDWICLSCLWIFFLTLKVKTEGKNGDAILSEAERAGRRIDSEREIFKRFEFSSS